MARPLMEESKECARVPVGARARDQCGISASYELSGMAAVLGSREPLEFFEAPVPGSGTSQADSLAASGGPKSTLFSSRRAFSSPSTRRRWAPAAR